MKKVVLAAAVALAVAGGAYVGSQPGSAQQAVDSPAAHRLRVHPKSRLR